MHPTCANRSIRRPLRNCQRQPIRLRPSWRVMGKEVVIIFRRYVAGKAFFESCLGKIGLAILIELTKPPTARRGILFRVLHHKL